MLSIPGTEALSPAVKYVIAFAIIFLLLALFALVLRRLTGGRLALPAHGRSRQPRLGIVDVYDLDRQRQLLLLRRDNVEHLLLIGGPNDVVIETNIVRVAGARIPAAVVNEALPERYDQPLDQAQRPPQVEAPGRPSIEAQLAAQLGAFVRRPSEESDVEEELAPIASVSAPVPAHSEPILKPDAVTVSAAPPIQALRAEARTAPFPSAPVPPAPAPAQERPEPRPPFAPTGFQSRPTPVPPSLAPAPPVTPQQPEPVRSFQPAPVERPAPVEKSVPDPAVLSDMAKQLEEALKRPASITAPAVSQAPHEDAADEDDLLEPASVQAEPQAHFDEPVQEDDLVEEHEPAPVAEPPRPAPEPTRPAPSPLPPQPPEAPAAPQAQKASDPFSVEDIEAEFARLLGRPLDTGKKG